MSLLNKGKICFGVVAQLIVWAVIIAFFAYITYFNVQKLTVIQAEKVEVEDEISEANRKTDELNITQEYQETDEFVEKVAREQLGLVMPDEIIFIKK